MELEKSIKRALKYKQRGECVISVEILETVLQALDNSIPKEKAKKKMETLQVAKERNIKRDFDTVYKDGYYTGGIDAIYELLEE